MILTVSNEFLLDYVLNNGVFIGDPQVITRGQMFTLLNLANQGIPPAGAMRFTIVANEGETFFMPTPEGGSYSYTVNWGDSMQDDIIDENGSHLFAAAGVYTVWLVGLCTRFIFDAENTQSNHMIYAVHTMGDLTLEYLRFYDCINLLTFTLGPDAVTSFMVTMLNFFRLCPVLTHLDLTGIDTAHIIEFNSSFRELSALENFDHSVLDMTLATDVQNMFSGCVAMLDAAPEWWNVETITQFEDCFLNNLLRSNYDDIPDDWKGILNDQFFILTEYAAARGIYTSDDRGENWILRAPFNASGAGAQISGMFATRGGEHIVLNDRDSGSQSSENVVVSHTHGLAWNTTTIAGGADGVSHSISPDGQIAISPRWNVTNCFITSDGGSSWQDTGVVRAPFGCGSIDMQYIYFAGDSVSSYKSIDYGASFQIAPAFVARRGSVICSEDGQTVFQTSSHAAVTPYVSNDFGETMNVTTGIGAAQGNIIISPDGTKAFFASSLGAARVLFSVDGGLNFSNSVIDTGAITVRPYNSLCGSYFIADNGAIAFYSGNVVYLSLDHGATFTEVYDFTPVGVPYRIDTSKDGKTLIILIQVGLAKHVYVADTITPSTWVFKFATPDGNFNLGCF